MAKLKERGRPFLEIAKKGGGGGGGGGTFLDYLQEHMAVIRDEKFSPFVKFEIILPLFCFLLDPLTNKHCRTSSSVINLWIDSSTCQK